MQTGGGIAVGGKVGEVVGAERGDAELHVATLEHLGAERLGPSARQLTERVEAEEREIVLPRFDVRGAWALGSRLRDAIAAADLPMVIGITIGEARVFHAAFPGSSADNDAWLDRKTHVARRYGRSSYSVGLAFRAAGRDFDTHGHLDTSLCGARRRLPRS